MTFQKPNNFYKKLLLLISIAVLLYFITNKLYLTNPTYYPISDADYDDYKEDNKTDMKYILIWNMEKDWSMEHSYSWSSGRERFIKEGCKENRCKVTDKRTARRIHSFDAIIFHQRAFRWKDIPNPKLRNKTQRYIHWMDEAPAHLYYDKTSLKNMDNFFNWTFTYRQNSTFFSPYGSIRQVKVHPTGAALESYISSFGDNNTHLATDKNSTSPIAWIVSNCHSESNREDLVKELQRYIGVDVFGGCGSLNCPKNETEKCLQGYRFYLALENAVCQDYITEKFFSIAKYGIIPITLNGAQMSKIAPPNSYINVLDFPSVKDLADYLQLLTNNDTLYASYFWWKDFYSVNSEIYTQGYCDVCAALHETNEETDKLLKAPRNMYKWWVEDAHCYKPTFSHQQKSFMFLYLLAILVLIVIVWTIRNWKMKSKLIES